MDGIAETSGLDRLDLSGAIRILDQAGLTSHKAPDLTPQERIQALIDALCELSVNDGLTGLVNTRFFHIALSRELDRDSRTGRPCALMMIDIDRFKQINDTYGHHAGDQVLAAVGLKLKASLRIMDTAARIGGDEFAVIFPECAPEDAICAAQRIHSLLNPIVVSSSADVIRVTTSAGVVWTAPGAAGTAKSLLERADAELYEAKRSGRSRLSFPALAPTRLSVAEHAALVMPGAEEDRYGK